MKKWMKITLISGGVGVGLLTIGVIIALIILIWPLPGGSGYTTGELIESFNEKRKEIYEVKRYFEALAPVNKDVNIEFDGSEITRLEITPRDTGKGSNLAVEFLDWNIPIGTKKADSIIKVLGWNSAKLEVLRDKLDAANCISITNEEPAKIGLKRSTLGMYFFNVFTKPIGDSSIAMYNDSCTYIFINRNLVLEYGGGAVGPQCFPKLN